MLFAQVKNTIQMGSETVYLAELTVHNFLHGYTSTNSESTRSVNKTFQFNSKGSNFHEEHHLPTEVFFALQITAGKTL